MGTKRRQSRRSSRSTHRHGNTADEASPRSLKRVKSDWDKIAGESLNVEPLGAAYYGFGSELGVLRLFHRYNQATRNPKTSAGYSKNMRSWYFRLE